MYVVFRKLCFCQNDPISKPLWLQCEACLRLEPHFMRTYVSRTPEMTSNYDVYEIDNWKKTLPKQLSYYSKSLRYAISKCVDLGDTRFELGPKSLEIRGFYMDFCQNWQNNSFFSMFIRYTLTKNHI